MERDKVYLKHMLDAILAIENYAGDFSKEEFLKDELVQDAVIRQLEITGEASKNLSSDFKKKHQNVAWKEVAGMRDKLIHDYFGVDLEIVWETIKQDIPFLKTEIIKMVSNL